MATTTKTRQTRRNRTAAATPPPVDTVVEPVVEPEPETPVVEPQPEPVATEEPKAPREKQAPLTLSQRRALLRLQQNDVWAPASGFAALPYEHLVVHGLASLVGDGLYAATEKGRNRTINPGYANWSAGETVAGDPTRPVHGTARIAKAQAKTVA